MDKTTIIIGSSDHHLYLFDSLGNIKRKFKTNGPIHTSAAIAPDGTIVFSSYDGLVYFLNPNGTLKLTWQPKVDHFAIYTAPAITPDGIIVIGSSDNNIYFLTPRGKLKTSFKAKDRITHPPLVLSDKTIVAASDDGSVYSFSPYGSFKNQFKVPGLISSPLLATAKGLVVATSYNHYIYFYHPNGKIQKEFQGSSQLFPIYAPNNNIAVISEYGYNYLFSPEGTLIGTHLNPIINEKSLSASSAGNDMLVGTDQGNIHLLSHTISPNLKFKFDFGTSSSPPTIAPNGMIILSTLENHLFFLNPDGTIVSKFKANNAFNYSAAIAPDGTIIAGSSDGLLYFF